MTPIVPNEATVRGKLFRNSLEEGSVFVGRVGLANGQQTILPAITVASFFSPLPFRVSDGMTPHLKAAVELLQPMQSETVLLRQRENSTAKFWLAVFVYCMQA